MNVLEALQSRGIEVRQSGNGYLMACCPFHDDANPSLSVQADTGSFKCFGCHEHGSFADLIAEIDSVPVAEAQRRVTQDESVETMLNSVERALSDDEEEKPRYYSLESFRKTFPAVIGTPGEQYLRGRGIQTDTMRKFDIRWGDHGVFQDRVVLPIRTIEGKIVSYVGRTIHESVKPKTRKEGSKKNTLFGIFFVYKWLVDVYNGSRGLVMVEGELDAVYLCQFGVPAVAVMGSGDLTPQQVKLVAKYDYVALSFDGDTAGRKAQKRIRDYLSQIMKVYTVSLPQGKDPNDLTRGEVEKYYGRYRAEV